jgi:hypothetical protein
MLSAVMLSVAMLSAFMLIVVMLSVILLNVNILNVIMLIVIRLNFMGPIAQQSYTPYGLSLCLCLPTLWKETNTLAYYTTAQFKVLMCFKKNKLYRYKFTIF